MNGTYKFFLKMVIFTITFYFMLEYVESCDVKTHIGMAVVLSIVTITSILFLVFRANKGLNNNITEITI
jgi:hypothetical protein